MAAKLVTGEEDILMISDDGTIIRMSSDDINTYSRYTQGVRVMRLNEGGHVISVAVTEREENEETEEPAAEAAEVQNPETDGTAVSEAAPETAEEESHE